MLCNVQQKIPCVFDTIVVHEASTKRADQPYKVLAGDVVMSAAVDADLLTTARATEKIDGTCVYVAEFNGTPWLWVRHDRKPNKSAEKRFKKYQHSKRLLSLKKNELGDTIDTVHQQGHHSEQCEDHGDTKESDFVWVLDKDFKDVPEYWIPASDVTIKCGLPQPDINGHIPGWIPVQVKTRRHCWHLSALNLEQGVALILQPQPTSLGHGDGSGADSSDIISLEIVCRSLSDLSGDTMELIGTHVNGNPYKLGSKEKPVHLLVRHGSIPVNLPKCVSVDRAQLLQFFEEEAGGQIEGIVWHCLNGDMFKLHRHHIQLTWPVPEPKLVTFPVSINLHHVDGEPNSLFPSLQNLNSKTFLSLSNINK